jgi:hypothetical protein
LNEAWNEAEEAAQKIWESEVEQPARELEAIRAAARSVAKQYAAWLEPIQREFNRKMKPLRERLELVRHAVQEKAEEFTVSVNCGSNPKLRISAVGLEDAGRNLKNRPSYRLIAWYQEEAERT